MSKRYDYTRDVINRDMYNDVRFNALIKEMKKFLSNHIQFDDDNYIVTSFVSDKLVINVQVKVDKFIAGAKLV